MSDVSILVVDDTFPMARALAFLLGKEGYRCRTAGDGVEALDMLEAEPADLIILDIQMPRMDGFEVCRRLRAHPTLCRTYIMVATALGEDADAARALEAGADECIAKPFDPPEVLRRVHRALSRETADRPS